MAICASAFGAGVGAAARGVGAGAGGGGGGGAAGVLGTSRGAATCGVADHSSALKVCGVWLRQFTPSASASTSSKAGPAICLASAALCSSAVVCYSKAGSTISAYAA